MTTQLKGSVFVAAIGRGDIGALAAPTDNENNSFRQLGTNHAYIPRYPNSGTALYATTSGRGGAGHVFTASNSSTKTDEVTLAVVEIINGGGISWQWNEVQAGAPITSLPIVTRGPATLIAFWWGDADGSVAQTATPSGGFTLIDSVLRAGSLVQCAVAAMAVAGAGTYSVTWTSTPSQGAQLWIVAVE